jgi:hypothetical protein
MSGKDDAPDPPDYGPLIAASTAASERNFQLGTEQLAWAKEQYAKDSAITSKVIDAGLERAAFNDANAARDRQRYEGVYQPLEDQLVADANSYNSEARRELEAGRAQAAVAENFETSRRAAAQELESYGIDPSSTRYAALDAGSRIAQAAAAAAAGNTARGDVEDRGRSLRSEALQIGQTYPGNIATTSSTSLQSGNQAANAGLATTASGANTMGTSTQYGQMGNQALGTAGALKGQEYDAAMAQYKAKQEASSGIGSLLGAGMGLLGASSNVAGATGLGMLGLALADGGAVPDTASPSAGKGIDDVPARLTAGEFVIPKDVLSWKGEEFFQKLIEGSRKSKPSAPAQPQRGAIPVEAPRFSSRSPIPMGA